MIDAETIRRSTAIGPFAFLKKPYARIVGQFLRKIS